MSENKPLTKLSTLGEFGLIRHLTQDIKLKNASSLKGVGDDAAVLDYKDKKILVSTDMLIEGVHFDLAYAPLKHLGYKAVATNASDIYAMNGTPRQITVSLVFPTVSLWKRSMNCTRAFILPATTTGLISWAVTRPLPKRECVSVSR